MSDMISPSILLLGSHLVKAALGHVVHQGVGVRPVLLLNLLGALHFRRRRQAQVREIHVGVLLELVLYTQSSGIVQHDL